ncbi:hypothetical protein [Streptomyces malaysiensis]|uniref:hypothetical protein n=1 Tax=Streptomyces malaysiensis TaxID=92644 RepID=UPI0027422848|nr:hypothetical protein [Streptomyces samsunensis]
MTARGPGPDPTRTFAPLPLRPPGARLAHRALALAVRDLLPARRPGVVAVGAEAGGSGGAVVVMAVNAAARTAGQDAAALVELLLHGRGGGSPDLAQGGGLPAGQLPQTLASIPALVVDSARPG